MEIKEILEKLNEFVEDVCYDTTQLYEFAIGRKEAKQRIQDLSDTIVDHICKILYLKHEMPDTVHHWCSEILAPLKKIIAIQLKGGKLKENVLLDWMRNWLTNPSEMEDRRKLVIMQQEITEDKCKPLELTDYDNVINTIKQLVKYVIQCRDNNKLPTLKDIEEICA